MLEKYCVIMSQKSAQRVALREIASKTEAAINVIAYVVTLREEKQLGSAGLGPETAARLARQSGALSMPHVLSMSGTTIYTQVVVALARLNYFV